MPNDVEEEAPENTIEIEEIPLVTNDALRVVDNGDPSTQNDEVETEDVTVSLRTLYLAQLLSTWGDQCSIYTTALAFTYIFSETWLPGVLFTLMGQLTNFLLGSTVGSWVDRSPRLSGPHKSSPITTISPTLVIRASLIGQNSAVVAVSIFQYLLFQYRDTFPPWHEWHFSLTYVGLLIAGCTSALFSMSRDIAVSRDWLVVVAQDRNTLTSANAVMKRINLVSKVAAPVGISVLLEYVGASQTVLILAAWNAISVIPEYLLLSIVYDREPKLAERQVDEKKKRQNPIVSLYQGWKTYSKQLVLGSSISYILLFMNGATPGSLTNSYLRFRGVDVLAIGIFQGIGAVVGLGATFATPSSIRRFGLAKTALAGIWLQHLLVLIAILSFWAQSLCREGQSVCLDATIYSFQLFIVLSRLGLWSFDICHVQIMQEGVDKENIGVVSGVEYSLTNLAFTVILAAGTVFNEPSTYIYVLGISYAAILTAGIVHTLWFYHKSKEALTERC
ncbi:hypothetical protein PROFUN_10523 [Planoprotostelium fungivorum]|uniref:Solute carrier family 40 member n=1 Tax=Planoprotostelium fungivorum TaxID=1890364 RepID=A0A2P6NDD1_9EUKA|nr:hypothetical protein PROFUN_10523 [Planoprotostelium fungivorum]